MKKDKKFIFIAILSVIVILITVGIVFFLAFKDKKSKPIARPSVSPIIKPSDQPIIKPSVKPIIKPTDQPTKPVIQFKDTSFQETANNQIPTIFNKYQACQHTQKCGRAVEILSLRDNLEILNFAYFPLSADYSPISYTTFKNDDKKHIITPNVKTTKDPVIVAIYYTAELYTIIGNQEDAGKVSTGSDDYKYYTSYIKQLQEEATKVFDGILSKNIKTGQTISWNKYFQYPGPNGRKWKDNNGNNITVDWTIQTDSENIETAIYIKPPTYDTDNYPKIDKRQSSSQYWGKFIPTDNILLYQAFCQLVKTELDECRKRYESVLSLDPNYKKGDDPKSSNWNNYILSPLAGDEGPGGNIDIYHALRKSIRATARVIAPPYYPLILTVYHRIVPNDLIQFMDDKFKEKINKGTTFQDVIFKNKINILGYLFMSNNINSAFAKYTGLSEIDYNSLRSMILLKIMGIGHSKSPQKMDKNVVLCPSESFNLTKFTLNNVPKSSYPPFKFPTYDSKNNQFSGTYCEVVDFMGDIHDYAVLVQQEYRTGRAKTEDNLPSSLANYVKNGATQIKNLFINSQFSLYDMFDAIEKGLLYQ